MKLAHRIVLILLPLGLTIHGLSRLQRGQTALREQNAELGRWRALVHGLSVEGTALDRELAQLRAQLQVAENPPASEQSLRSWLRQVARLRDLFADRPDQAIPELQLLSSFDWLRLAQAANLETEPGIRRALADARDTASYKFVSRLGTGVREFKKTHEEWPATLAEFATYVQPALDPTTFERYRLGVSGRIGRSQGNYGINVVLERSPVDPEYDHFVHGVNDTGGAGGMFSWQQAPLQFAIQSARLAYLSAHDWTTPRGDTRYYEPYLEPAAMREIVTAQSQYYQDIQTQARSGGALVRVASELFPYLSTPEAKALAEQLWPAKKEEP